MSTAQMIEPNLVYTKDNVEGENRKMSQTKQEGCEETEHISTQNKTKNILKGIGMFLAGAIVTALVSFFFLWKSPIAVAVYEMKPIVEATQDSVEDNSRKIISLTNAFIVLAPELQTDNEIKAKIIETLLEGLTE